MRPMQCDWCGYVPHPLVVLIAMEDYGRLCPGCYFCWKHGTPRRMEEDRPFTEERKSLQSWSRKLFATIRNPLEAR